MQRMILLADAAQKQLNAGALPSEEIEQLHSFLNKTASPDSSLPNEIVERTDMTIILQSALSDAIDVTPDSSTEDNSE